MMPQTELRRLLGYQYASHHKPTQAKRIPSRRTSKSAATATGQKFLLRGKIISEVPLEKHFIKRK